MTIPPVRDGQYVNPQRMKRLPAAGVRKPDFTRLVIPTAPPATNPASGPAEQASVFNQYGYFHALGQTAGQKTAASSSDTVPVASPRIDNAPCQEPQAGPEGDEPDPLLQQLSQGLGYASNNGKASVLAGPRHTSSIMSNISAARPTQPLMPLTMAVALTVDMGGVIDPPVSTELAVESPMASSVVSTSADGSATVNVQVNVSPVDEQISISARADRLSREERAHLRLEIARLLARYGFTPGDIILNGEMEPEISFMKKGR